MVAIQTAYDFNKMPSTGHLNSA